MKVAPEAAVGVARQQRRGQVLSQAIGHPLRALGPAATRIDAGTSAPRPPAK